MIYAQVDNAAAVTRTKEVLYFGSPMQWANYLPTCTILEIHVQYKNQVF